MNPHSGRLDPGLTVDRKIESDPGTAAVPLKARPATPARANAGPAGPESAPPVPLLSNAELARIFSEIGDMLEIKGELVYKAVAYRRVADSIEHCAVEVASAYRERKPPKLVGVGPAIAKKLQELADTGRLAYYEKLRAEVPRSLLEMLAVPGIGPRTVKTLYEELGIASLYELRVAAEAGQLRHVKGMTAHTEENILLGIGAIERRSTRMRLGRADHLAEWLRAALEGTRGLVRLDVAGSYRRRAPTIGDLDLLAATTDPETLAERFVTMPGVERVLARGTHKCAVALADGPQVDLMMAAPEAYGTFLIHFTGSKDHNVHLRGLARERGWSLSENGFLRLGPDGEPLSGAEAELRIFPDEARAYRFLDLPWIEPELREDRGEIEAAMAAQGSDGRLPARPGRGRLPVLVEARELRGDCHSHSRWSDGVYEIEEMAEAARDRGYAYLVLADHSAGLGIARGLTVERAREQREVVADLNARFARDEAEGRAPPATPPEGFRLLHGVELEIRADGRLDFDDAALAEFDVVVASLHQARRQTPEQLTLRVLSAIRSPHVDIVAHPAGRLIGERDPLVLDWEAIFAEAARTGTLLEINGSDHRLDLDDGLARRARAAGCRFVVDSDAHRVEELAAVGWGISVARRAWLTRDDIVNTRSREAFLATLKTGPGAR